MLAAMSSKIVDPRLVDKYLRVVLPKDVAKVLRVGPGDHVAFVVEGDRIEVRRVKISLD